MLIDFMLDDEKLHWEFKPDRLLTSEAEALEKVTGLSFTDWVNGLMSNQATACRGLVWILRKRTEPTLRYGAVDFPMGDLSIDFDAEEKSLMRDQILASNALTDEERTQALEFLGFDPTEVPDEDGPGNDSGNGSAADGS